MTDLITPRTVIPSIVTPFVGTPSTIRILIISYVYTDKKVDGRPFGKICKDYYENNARGKLIIDIDYVDIKVPFPSTKTISAIPYATELESNFHGYRVCLHFCNPRTSRADQYRLYTYASKINSVHELGHSLGLTHASNSLSGKVIGSKDQFDQMTNVVAYASTNSIHRWQMEWFLPGELVDVTTLQDKGIHRLGSLKNFDDRVNTKVVKDGRVFISYGNFYGTNYIVCHKLVGRNNSELYAIYNPKVNAVFRDETSGFDIKVLEIINKKGIDTVTLDFVKFKDVKHAPTGFWIKYKNDIVRV